MCECFLPDAETRKARRPHSCVECGDTIRPGDRYVHHASLWEGSVTTWACCLDCDAWGDALAEAQRRECGCSGWELGRMWEAIAEFAAEHLSADREAA
jgi:hypothetical protein